MGDVPGDRLIKNLCCYKSYAELMMGKVIHTIWDAFKNDLK